MKSLSIGQMVGPSKILERRWKERDALLHKQKISQVKSNIRKYQALSEGVLNQTNLKFNAKKESVKEGKLSNNHHFYFCFSYRAIYPNREGKQNPPRENVKYHVEE